MSQYDLHCLSVCALGGLFPVQSYFTQSHGTAVCGMGVADRWHHQPAGKRRSGSWSVIATSSMKRPMRGRIQFPFQHDDHAVEGRALSVRLLQLGLQLGTVGGEGHPYGVPRIPAEYKRNYFFSSFSSRSIMTGIEAAGGPSGFNPPERMRASASRTVASNGVPSSTE